MQLLLCVPTIASDLSQHVTVQPPECGVFPCSACMCWSGGDGPGSCVLGLALADATLALCICFGAGDKQGLPLGFCTDLCASVPCAWPFHPEVAVVLSAAGARDDCARIEQRATATTGLSILSLRCAGGACMVLPTMVGHHT